MHLWLGVWVVSHIRMSHSYLWKSDVSRMNGSHEVTWRMWIRHATHVNESYDSIFCVTWRICMCDMTHSCVWLGSFIVWRCPTDSSFAGWRGPQSASDTHTHTHAHAHLHTHTHTHIHTHTHTKHTPYARLFVQMSPINNDAFWTVLLQYPYVWHDSHARTPNAHPLCRALGTNKPYKWRCILDCVAAVPVRVTWLIPCCYVGHDSFLVAMWDMTHPWSVFTCLT